MSLELPLNSPLGLTLDGPHRFVAREGRTGLHVSSLNTSAACRTDLHQRPRGTLSIWFNPLEDLGAMPEMEHLRSKDANAFFLPLVSDALPARDLENGYFGIWWNAGWYPKLMAKFCHGRLFPPMDFVMLPWVYADWLALRRGCWYHVVLTWDKPAARLRLYFNGVLAGHNDRMDHFDRGRGALQLGNPVMLLSELSLAETVWTESEVAEAFLRGGGVSSPEIERSLLPVNLPAGELSRDRSWRQALARSFTERDDLADWLRQGPQYYRLPHCGITSEGLLVQTPDELAVDSRTYLWSPVTFEGDMWIEYEFRPEAPRGLALLVVCASGPQREDFISDHGLPRGGGMGTIIADRVRNYHWEYFRRVEAMRTDVETQFLCKNPWQRPLAFAVRPKLTEGQWHRLRLVKIGPRIHASLDGHTVFDAEDKSWYGTGPWYDFGRIALRQMYHTTMRYRNFSVHTRDTEATP